MIHHNTIRTLKDLIESNKMFLKSMVNKEYDLCLFENDIERVYSKWTKTT